MWEGLDQKKNETRKKGTMSQIVCINLKDIVENQEEKFLFNYDISAISATIEYY